MIESVNILFQDYIETEYGCIYIPTVKDFLRMGENQIMEHVLPYRLSLDIIDLDEEVKEQIKIFDLFFQKFKAGTNKDIFDILMSSLEYFFRLKPVFNEQAYCIQIGDVVVNRDNFDALADIILLVSQTERIEKEVEPVFKNETQKDVYFKIQEGRRKKAEKNKISIATIMNCVVHGGKSYIPYSEVATMTLPQLNNTFSAITGVNDWEMNFDKYLVGVEPKKLDLTYWIYRLKL